MQKGKKGGVKKHPNYVGIFASDAKQANKIVRGICKDTILEIMKQIHPESYLEEGEQHIKSDKIYQHERDPAVQEVQQVERDLLQFEEFKSPADNYHLTCLYIGNKIEKLSKKQQLLYKGWKEGHKQAIKVDFIVYVPNYIMAAYISDVGQVDVDNEFPHMTLLLKSGTSAVQSNAILELLSKYHPELFKYREKYITPLHIPFKGSQLVFVIDRHFAIEGICGNNHTHGRC